MRIFLSVLFFLFISFNTICAKAQSIGDTVKQNKEAIEKLEKTAMPVGTIISSLIPYGRFRSEYGDSWVPADGRNVSNSKYANITGKSALPDLRGMFLRGLNEFENGRERYDGKQDPDARAREGGDNPGSFQEDAFQGHYHNLNKDYDSSEEDHGDGTTIRVGRHRNRFMKVEEPITDGTNGEPRTSKETRPKNIAVYYYIKIK